MGVFGSGARRKLQRLSSNLVILFLALVILVSPLASCTSDSGKTPPPGGEAIFPMTVTDDLGRVVTIPEKPVKIVSLAPSNTEILFALGLAERVIAVSDYSDYPPEAKEKPVIAVYPAPNMEQLIDLSPDLILAAEIQTADVILQLEERGFTVFVLAPQTLDEVLESITLVGEITGKEGEASLLVADMRNRIKSVTDRTDSLPQGQRPRVFYIAWHDPLMAPGSGTFQDELIRKAGGTNVARDLIGWAIISLEVVVQANPEVMIASFSYATGEDLSFRFIKEEPRLSNTDARRNDRVYGIDESVISRPGPRIVEALELLAKMLHPEIFGSAP
jgi:iron complex transport system substrate-binding protein